MIPFLGLAIVAVSLWMIYLSHRTMKDREEQDE